MIDKMKLIAFKTFPNESINFGPLTVLSGMNNCGKSSIIQAIRMYERSFKSLSPLLDGHGLVSELRSKLSSQSADIEIELFMKGRSSVMRLSDQSVTPPNFCPIISYVGANRLGPQTSLPLNRSLESFPIVGDQGEFILDYIDKLNDAIIPPALIHLLSQGQTLEYVLTAWLSEIAPSVEFGFNVNAKTDLAHAVIDNYRPTNAGFGISYTLPIIAAILGMAAVSPSLGWTQDWGREWESAKKKNGALLILENPEAHLHPRGQTAMGQMIALAVACGVQVIIETHSDHLIDGIRIAVKEKLIAAEKVVFHFLSKQKDGVSKLESPKLYSNGKLDFWPKDFFDQTLINRAVLAKSDG